MLVKWMFIGNLFQSLGTMTENPLSPMQEESAPGKSRRSRGDMVVVAVKVNDECSAMGDDSWKTN